MQHEWQPVKSLVLTLRSKYSDYAVFFYNEFCPDIIAMIWRPSAFIPHSFSAISSAFKRPVTEFWKDDSLVITNTDDLMSEIGYSSMHIVTDMKVLDDKKPFDAPIEKRHKESHHGDTDEDSDSEDD